MTAEDVAGTILVEPRYQAGEQYTVLGKFTIADTIESGDSFTFTDMLPDNTVEIVSGKYYGAEADTDGSPTATITVGDGTDVDGYLTSKTAGGTTPLHFDFDGVLMGTDDYAGRDVVVTFAGTVAGGASSGDGFVEITYYCLGDQG